MCEVLVTLLREVMSILRKGRGSLKLENDTQITFGLYGSELQLFYDDRTRCTSMSVMAVETGEVQRHTTQWP